MQNVRDVSAIPLLVHDAYLAFVDICNRYGTSDLPGRSSFPSGKLLEQPRAGRTTTDWSDASTTSDVPRELDSCGCACGCGSNPLVLHNTSVNVSSGHDDKRGSDIDRSNSQRPVVNDRKADAGSWRVAGGRGVGATTVSSGRVTPGVHTERNRLKREKAKERKARKKLGVDSVSVDLPNGRSGRPVRANDSPEGSGFWKSCDEDVRRELIASKARMHIAENERKTAEARSRVDYLKSPKAIADQVLRLASQLESHASLAQNQAVAGWAQTVLLSSAETTARSAPSSVPSYSTFITERSEREAAAAEAAKLELESQRLKELEQKRLDDQKSAAKLKSVVKPRSNAVYTAADVQRERAACDRSRGVGGSKVGAGPSYSGAVKRSVISARAEAGKPPKREDFVRNDDWLDAWARWDEEVRNQF